MNIEDKITELLKEASDNLPNNYRSVDLFDSGVLDSLTVMQLVGELGDAFDIEIDVDDVVADNFNSFDHIVALVKKYLG